jgi:hypothetical protein
VQDIKGTTFWLWKTTGTIVSTTIYWNRLKKYHG